jgi:hypothetical protein
MDPENTQKVSDANNASASSAEAQTSDANEGSASSQQNNSTESSSAKELTVRQIVQQTVDASQATAEGDQEQESGSKIEPDAEKTGDAGDGEGDSADEFSMKKEDGEGEELPPFNEHPRWKEMVQERDEHKRMVEEYKPLVEAHQSVVDYCRANGVTPEKYQRAIKLAALIETDPEAARAELEPIWQQLQGEVGEAIPQDLRDDVEAGVLSEERAKELAKLRKQQERFTKRTAQQQQQMALTAQQQAVNQITNAVVGWEKAIKKTNPDFVPKKGKDQPDGVYEWWLVKLESMIRANGAKDPAEAVRMAEEAFKQVTSSVSRFVPKAPERKAISSSRSATNNNNNGKTQSVRDIVYATAKKHGVGA